MEGMYILYYDIPRNLASEATTSSNEATTLRALHALKFYPYFIFVGVGLIVNQ